MMVESAMLIALGVVLEFVSKMFIPELPYGGQITLVNMLPILLISYRYGVKWGLFSAFTYSLLQIVLGLKTVTAAFQPGVNWEEGIIFNAILMLILDYLVAYTVLGLGGLFRNKIKNNGLSLMCGGLLALFLRYLAHILSGYILYAQWAEWFFTQEGFPAWGAELVASVSTNALSLIYSIFYNGMYMVPEIVLTAIASLLVAKIPGIVVKKH